MAPVAVAVTVAVKEPAASPAVLTNSVTADVPVDVVPDELEKVSQLALSATDQFRVPVPVFEIVSVCEGGFAAPWVAVKEKVFGLRPMVAVTGAAVTVKDTGMVTGLAPVALMVTAAV